MGKQISYMNINWDALNHASPNLLHVHALKFCEQIMIMRYMELIIILLAILYCVYINEIHT